MYVKLCVLIGSSFEARVPHDVQSGIILRRREQTPRCADVFRSAGFFSVQPITESVRNVTGHY